MMKLLSSAMNSSAQRDTTSIYGQRSTSMVTLTSMCAAVAIVASVSILVGYPFLQKYFVSGVISVEPS